MNQGDWFALATALAWSSAVICFKFAGGKIGAISLNIFKNMVAIIFFWISVFFIGVEISPSLPREEWARILISGFLGITLGDVLFIASLNRLGAGLQAIVDCFYAPCVLLLAYLMFGEMLPPLALVGGALVITGVVIGSRKIKLAAGQTPRRVASGIALGLASQLVMAFGLLMVRDLMDHVSLVWMTAVRFTFAQIVLVSGTAVFLGMKRVSNAFREQIRNPWAITGALCGPYLSTMLWFAGYKHTEAGRAAIFNQTSAIFIILLAAKFLGEPITQRKVFALSLGVAGALIVSLS